MTEMKAIIASSEGPIIANVPVPTVRAEEVMVKVKAAALNRADLGMLKGAPHGKTGGAGVPLGLEFSGEIVEVGRDVTQWRIGDRVMCAGGSAYAEYAVGHCRRMYSIPDGLSFQEAATFPVALQTEYDAIATHGRISQGQSVLIQGASSGVGLIGMQVAKYLGAGLVIGTSTSPERLDKLQAYGADLAIDTRNGKWEEQVLNATDRKGVDILIDHVSGMTANNNMKATRIGGCIVNVGRLGGMHGEFNFDLHALRRIRYEGVTFRTRNATQVEDIVKSTTTALLPGLESGAFKLPIHQVFSLAETNEAFAVMKRNEHFGKLVIDI